VALNTIKQQSNKHIFDLQTKIFGMYHIFVISAYVCVSVSCDPLINDILFRFR
jgi:hypothetical protein